MAFQMAGRLSLQSYSLIGFAIPNGRSDYQMAGSNAFRLNITHSLRTINESSSDSWDMFATCHLGWSSLFARRGRAGLLLSSLCLPTLCVARTGALGHYPKGGYGNGR